MFSLISMETKSHFTFLQGINGRIIIMIDKNQFDTYLVDKKHPNQETGVISWVVASKD